MNSQVQYTVVGHCVIAEFTLADVNGLRCRKLWGMVLCPFPCFVSSEETNVREWSVYYTGNVREWSVYYTGNVREWSVYYIPPYRSLPQATWVVENKYPGRVLSLLFFLPFLYFWPSFYSFSRFTEPFWYFHPWCTHKKDLFMFSKAQSQSDTHTHTHTHRWDRPWDRNTIY